MTTESLPAGPDPEAITRTIHERYPDSVVLTIPSATFFSLDPKGWPNFATIVTTDQLDEGEPSRLSRPGVFRLNIGVGRATFERLVGGQTDPDYAALDRFMPHPVYAKQLWVSILNPSEGTFREAVLPLLEEAHRRLARGRARRARARPDGPAG